MFQGMQGPPNPASGRNSGHGRSRHHARNESIGMTGVLPWSTEGGGTGAMPFSNRTSAPSFSTASPSSSQIAGGQDVQVDSNSFADLSSGGDTRNIYMNNDYLGIDPRYLTISPSDPQYRRHNQPEQEGDNVQATSVPHRLLNLPPPLDFTFQGSPVNSLSPTTLPPPSSAGSSYSNDAPNQVVHPSMSVRQQPLIDEHYWQQQNNEFTQFTPRDHVPGYPGFMPNYPLPALSTFYDHRSSFDTSLPIMPQDMGNVVYSFQSNQPAMSLSAEQSGGTSYIANQNAGAPIASSSSPTTGMSTPESINRPGPTSPERPVRRRQKSQKKMAPRIQISTGQGPQNQLNMSMPDWPLSTGSAAGPSPMINLTSLSEQQTIFEATSGSHSMQTRSTDKGKGKQDDTHITTKGSSSSRKKGEDNVKRYTMKSKPVWRRPRPNRPQQIDCPFPDCSQTIPNMEGLILRHVESCPSSQVRAVRESRQGTHRIECPTCRGRRSFVTLKRWAIHLFEAHGEWKVYPCEVQGCGAMFVFEKDRNEHMRIDHQT